jgi:hypothetical protein
MKKGNRTVAWLLHVSGKGWGVDFRGGGGFPSTGKIKDIIGTRGRSCPVYVGLGTKLANTDVCYRRLNWYRGVTVLPPRARFIGSNLSLPCKNPS